MKYILLLTLLIGNFAFAEKLVPIDYIKNADGDCVAFLNSKSKHKPLGHLIYPGSLESKYCQRMFPKSHKDAFSKDRDIPAKRLAFDITEIDSNIERKELSAALHKTSFQSNKGKKLATISININKFDELSAQVDWDSFYELNKEAIELWNKLSKNYGPEQARFNYYKKRKFSKEDKNSIEIFRRNVLSYLKSTEIGNTWGLNLLGRVHPLITQITLETLVSDYPYYVIDNGFEFYKGTNFGMAARYVMLSEEIDWKSSFNKTNHISIINDVEDSDLYRLDEDDMKFFNGIPSGNFKEIQLYLNSIYILQMASENQCSDWGLWPGISRVVLNYLTIVDQGRSPDHPHGLVLNNIMEKVNQACGHIVYGEIFKNRASTASVSPIYRSRNKHSKKLAKEFKKLAKRWK